MRNALVIAMVMAVVVPASAETLDEILAKNLAARGGEAKLREVKTLRLTGRVVFGGGDSSIEAPMGTGPEAAGAACAASSRCRA